MATITNAVTQNFFTEIQIEGQIEGLAFRKPAQTDYDEFELFERAQDQ